MAVIRLRSLRGSLTASGQNDSHQRWLGMGGLSLDSGRRLGLSEGSIFAFTGG